MREKHSRTENNKIVRVQNVETIISLMQRNDPVTTELLVSRSGLSYPTVFGIVKALLEAGIAEQQGYASSTGGRQAHLYSICASYAYTFGIHITSTWLDVALTNLKGGVVYQHRLSLTGLEDLEKLVAAAIDLALRHVRLPVEKLLAACICVSPRVKSRLSETGADLCAVVRQMLKAPVEIVSDSAVQAFLDWETLSCSEERAFLHVVFGDSVHMTHYNASGRKFEIPGTLSHLTLVPGGAECRCGRKGCLETYFNGLELQRRYDEALTRAGREHVPPETIRSRGLMRHLLNRSLLQDPCAEEVLEGAVEALAVVLANLMTLADEYCMVLSGLYSSNDTRNFRKLRAAVARNLPESGAAKLDLSMGLTLPAECALGASRMMNSKYACQIGRDLETLKRRAKQ